MGLLRTVRGVHCLLVTALLLSGTAAAAQQNRVRIGGLSDVPFGLISNFQADSVLAQDICVFSSSPTQGYRVTAMGDGPGGDFHLVSPTDALAYEVLWSDVPGRRTGALLSPNVPLTGQTSTASQQFCNAGPATSASLIVRIRASAIQSVTTGVYSGSLTLILGVE